MSEYSNLQPTHWVLGQRENATAKLLQVRCGWALRGVGFVPVCTGRCDNPDHHARYRAPPVRAVRSPCQP